MTATVHIRARIPLVIALVAVPALADCFGPVNAQEPIDSLMGRDPVIEPAKAVKVFSPRLPEIWKQALDRPDADTKSRAAIDIAQAHERGMTGLEGLVAPMVRELDRPGQHPAVLATVARALVMMDAKSAAPSLARAAAAAGPDVQEIVEPALARWKYEPARAGWLARLELPPYRRGAILAIQGLTATGDDRYVPRFRELALDRKVPPPVRLEAARAAGTRKPSGFESDAERLIADRSVQGLAERLVAASLLQNHAGTEAIRLLQGLARDPEPAVAVIALRRLVAIDPATALPVLEAALASPGGEVRTLAVEVLYRLPSEPHLALLGDRLADPHPDVRTKARQSLRELAGRSSLRPSVVREGARLLAGADWRGQEQSAILLAQLGHTAAAPRLLELLPSSRPEVGVASAWGLRVLAVPETLPAVLEVVRSQDKMLRASKTRGGREDYPAEAVDQQLSQLVQLFGVLRYRPADSLLRTFVPRCPLGDEARAAAAWALGKIHEGTQVPEMVPVLASRVAAVNPGDTENPIIRSACAVTLGRIKGEGGLPTLWKFYPSRKPSLDEVNNACGWAIEQITGEKMPPPGTVEHPQQGWFLTPLDTPAGAAPDRVP